MWLVLEARDRVGGRVWSQQLVPGDPRSVVERGGEFVLDGYDVMAAVMAELGLELADMTMSYYEREPRGAGHGSGHGPVCRGRGSRRRRGGHRCHRSMVRPDGGRPAVRPARRR
jgi:hypothetical protein